MNVFEAPSSSATYEFYQALISYALVAGVVIARMAMGIVVKHKLGLRDKVKLRIR